MSPPVSEVEAVLQAGGRGTRLLPTTREVPKPLVHVGGMPLVERLLRQFVACGICKITVITGWLGERVESHLLGLTDLPSNLQITFLREAKPTGNIGSLGRLSPLQKPILFAFGDLVTNLDFSKLLDIHRELGARATLASHYESHQLTLGELRVDGDYVSDYREKPVKQFLICSGIAVFEPDIVRLIDPARPFGISDLVKAALAKSMKVAHWTHGAFWVDVNNQEALELAEKELSRRSQSARV